MVTMVSGQRKEKEARLERPRVWSLNVNVYVKKILKIQILQQNKIKIKSKNKIKITPFCLVCFLIYI